MDISLTPPAPPTGIQAPQYVESYVFTYTYTSVSVVTRSVVVPFNSSNIYRLDPLPTGLSVSITAKTVDYSGQVGTVASAPLVASTPVDTVPPAARTITAVVLSGGGVLVTLDTINTEADFLNYELWRGEGPNAGAVVWGSSPLFNFLATAVEDRNIPTSASDYFYKVVSKDFSGNGATSNIFGPLTLITTNVPPPPGPNMATATATPNADGSITLSWTPVTSAGLAGYRVWRRLHTTTAWTQIQNMSASSGIPNPVTFTDNLTVSGTQYDYNITAYNSTADESAISTTFLTATALDTTAPAAPGAIAVTGRSGGLYVVWTASTSADVVSYGVSYRLTPVSSYSTETRVNANQFTILGLTQTRDSLSNNLGIKVVAYDSAGNGSAASTYTVTFPDLAGYTPADSTIPAGPASLTVNKNDDGSVLLSWPASVSPDRSGYQVEKYEALNVSGFHIQTTGGTTTLKYFFTIGAGTTGVTYTWSMWMQNIGIAPVRIGGNLGEGPIFQPGQRGLVTFSVTAINNTTQVQFRFETLNVADNVNVIAYLPQVVRSSDQAQIFPVASQNFFIGWTTSGGATLIPGGQPPSQNILISDFWDIEGIVQDDTAGTKTFRIGGLEPFSFRGKQYRFRVRTTDYSGNISSINLLDDPGFESGTTNSWTLMADAGAVASVTTTTPNSGLESLTANQAARPSQVVAVTGGAFYSFSAYMASAGGPGILATIKVEWYKSDGTASTHPSDQSAGFTPTVGYQRIPLSVAAPADAAFARAYLNGDPGNPTISVLWDDTQFEQAAAPTAFNPGQSPLINAIDQVAPLDYTPLNFTATGALGVISLRWNLPLSTFSGAYDYIGSVFEIWRQVTTSAQPSLPTDAAFRKISEVPGSVPPNGATAVLNFDDLDPDETFNVTASYKLKARDRFGNISGFLNAGVAVSATSKTPNDISVARKDGLTPTAPVMSATTGAVAGTSGTITISWTGSTTAGRNDLAGYHIYRQLNGAGSYVPIGDVFTNAEGGTQSWVDTGLDIGNTTYNYKVSAFDTAMEESALSGASNIVTPVDNRIPAPPSNVILKGGVGSIQLQWSPSPTTGVTCYRVGIPAIAGQAAFTQDVTDTGVLLRMPGGPSAAALQAASYYTGITVEAISRSGGGQVNICPDSDFGYNTWIGSSAIVLNAGTGFNSGYSFQYTGTGAAAGFQVMKSLVINVTPGTIYTLSGWVDASHVTSGSPGFAVENPAVTSGFLGVFQTAGVSGRVTGSFTVPAGVTQVVVIMDTENCVVASGQILSFSNPQLEVGLSATTYQATNPFGGVLAATDSPSNIIPDSNLTGSWTVAGAGLAFSPTGGAIAGGSFVQTGTGATQGFTAAVSPVITVVPNMQYTLSGYIDATNATTTRLPVWQVWNPGITTNYLSVPKTIGSAGRVTGTFIVPAGVTQVVVICDNNNTVVTNGLTISWSDPQLELGNTASVYQSSLPDMQAYVPIDTVPPTDPTGITATADGQGSVTISWTGSTSTDVFSYVVEMAQETGNLTGVAGPWVGVGTTYAPTTSIRVPGLQPTVISGLRYQFRVKALDNSNNASNYATSAFTVTTVDTTPPAVPTNIVASASLESDSQTTTSRVNITWTKVTDRDLAMYVLEFFRTDGLGGHSMYSIPPLITSYSIGALKNGVQYGVILYSQDFTGNRSAGSTLVNVTTPTPPPSNHTPGPPTLVGVTSGAGPSGDTTTSTITVTFNCGYGGGSSGPEASAPFTFPADNDLSFASIRRATSTQAGANVGPQSGTKTISASAVFGAQFVYTEVVGRNGDGTSYSLFYKVQIVDTSGAVSSPSSEVSVTVTGYNDGGSGGPLCPAVEMYLPDGALVETVPIGHEVLCLKEGKTFWRPLERSRTGTRDCVRLWTDNGCSVVVSVETPMELEDGSGCMAEEMEGRKAATWIDGHLEWSPCHVEHIGPHRVRLMSLGGHIFAAGAFPDRCIFTHNVVVLPKA